MHGCAGGQSEEHRVMILIERAEQVAEVSMSEVRRELACEAPVDENTSFDSH